MKRLSYPWAQGVIAVSEEAADDLARVLNVPRWQIHVIYNPTYDDALLERAKEPVEHAWFRSGEPPVILGVGRLTHQKDFATLLRAFARVRKEVVCRLVILGEGDERARLQALAEELGVRRDVDLPGFVENPYAYMARAAIFVLSSRYEGLPNVLIEALACGVPVVSTDCPSGPREILLDGDAGVLIPVGDHDKMAQEIIHVLWDQGRARRFVLEGQEGLGRFRPETCYYAHMKLIGAEIGHDLPQSRHLLPSS
jgi:glycosyltransferase involved in cell wall biosynthesis